MNKTTTTTKSSRARFQFSPLSFAALFCTAVGVFFHPPQAEAKGALQSLGEFLGIAGKKTETSADASTNPPSTGSVEHKPVLNLTKNNWVSFREYDGNLLLYFTHLLTYRGSLSKIRYGLNADKPDQDFAFPSYDKPGIAEVPSGEALYIKAPKETSFVTVQVTYKDNTESEIVRISK